MSIYSSSVSHIRRKRWLKIVLIGLLAIAIISIISWNRFEHWYGNSLKPVAEIGQDVSFTVVSGDTADEIGKNLEEAGLINSGRAFTIYLDRTGQRALLQAGAYKLNTGMETNEIADIIAEGRIDIRLLTIIPGYRLDQIEQHLLDSGFSQAEVTEALNASYDHPLIAKKPGNATLEGYIYPESFQFTTDTKLKDLFRLSFDEFWGQVDDSILGGIKQQGLTFHEAVTLASIVALESPNPDEQQKIAQVFLRRLDEGISLGADPTFKYAAALAGVDPTVNIDSPYNTRIVTGLPPGPIANFGFSALEAVAKPANTDYLFFVAGDDGVTRFSNTLEEHEALVEKYCFENCKL